MHKTERCLFSSSKFTTTPRVKRTRETTPHGCVTVLSAEHAFATDVRDATLGSVSFIGQAEEGWGSEVQQHRCLDQARRRSGIDGETFFARGHMCVYKYGIVYSTCARAFGARWLTGATLQV